MHDIKFSDGFCVMNTKQISTLQAMDVDIWASNQRKVEVLSDPIKHYCLVDELEFKQVHLKELFLKIIKALGWSKMETKIVSQQKAISSRIDFNVGSIVIVFGQAILNDTLTSQMIRLPSLTQMMTHADAKRQAWNLLKAYKQ